MAAGWPDADIHDAEGPATSPAAAATTATAPAAGADTPASVDGALDGREARRGESADGCIPGRIGRHRPSAVAGPARFAAIAFGAPGVPGAGPARTPDLARDRSGRAADARRSHRGRGRVGGRSCRDRPAAVTSISPPTPSLAGGPAPCRCAAHPTARRPWRGRGAGGATAGRARAGSWRERSPFAPAAPRRAAAPGTARRVLRVGASSGCRGSPTGPAGSDDVVARSTAEGVSGGGGVPARRRGDPRGPAETGARRRRRRPSRSATGRAGRTVVDAAVFCEPRLDPGSPTRATVTHGRTRGGLRRRATGRRPVVRRRPAVRPPVGRTPTARTGHPVRRHVRRGSESRFRPAQSRGRAAALRRALRPSRRVAAPGSTRARAGTTRSLPAVGKSGDEPGASSPAVRSPADRRSWRPVPAMPRGRPPVTRRPAGRPRASRPADPSAPRGSPSRRPAHLGSCGRLHASPRRAARAARTGRRAGLEHRHGFAARPTVGPAMLQPREPGGAFAPSRRPPGRQSRPPRAGRRPGRRAGRPAARRRGVSEELADLVVVSDLGLRLPDAIFWFTASAPWLRDRGLDSA